MHALSRPSKDPHAALALGYHPMPGLTKLRESARAQALLVEVVLTSTPASELESGNVIAEKLSISPQCCPSDNSQEQHTLQAARGAYPVLYWEHHLMEESERTQVLLAQGPEGYWQVNLHRRCWLHL